MSWQILVYLVVMPVVIGLAVKANIRAAANAGGGIVAKLTAAATGLAGGFIVSFLLSAAIVIVGNGFRTGLESGLWHLGFAAALMTGLWFWFSRSRQAGEAVLRGAQVFDFTHAKAVPLTTVAVGGVPLPEQALPLSFIAAGSPGSGKSQALNRIMTAIRNRGEVAIVADAGGEAMACLYREGDFIFNPLDTRSVDWSPFAEMCGPWDAARLAASIVPSKEGSDAEWYKMSQDLVQAVLLRLWESGKSTNRDLLHYLTIAKAEEVETLIAGMPAQALFDSGAGKMLASVRGIVGTQLAAFSYLDPAAGRDAFSIQNWFLEARQSGSWLWMPYRTDMVDMLKSLIACAVDVVATTALSQRPDLTARMAYLVIDELPAAGKIDSLKTVLAQGRKYRLAAFCGFQSVSQMEAIHGKQGMQTLMACFQNRLILRTVDPDTAEYLSKMVGDHEIERQTESTSTTSGGEHSTKSTSVRLERKVQRAILPAQIQSLPSRTGFLAVAEQSNIYRVSVPIVELDEQVPPFLLKSFETRAPETAKKMIRTPPAACDRSMKIEIE